MGKKENQRQAYEQFKDWERRTNSTINTIRDQKHKMDASEPMVVPRAYVIAGIIAITALVIAAFPILLFGAALGAFIFAKLSQDWKIK